MKLKNYIFNFISLFSKNQTSVTIQLEEICSKTYEKLIENGIEVTDAYVTNTNKIRINITGDNFYELTYYARQLYNNDQTWKMIVINVETVHLSIEQIIEKIKKPCHIQSKKMFYLQKYNRKQYTTTLLLLYNNN